jgi:hypothetical protein
MRRGAQTVAESAVALAARRAALAAVQPAHAPAAHRRLPAAAAIRFPPRLAAQCVGRIAARVAVPQGACPKGHGVSGRFGLAGLQAPLRCRRSGIHPPARSAARTAARLAAAIRVQPHQREGAGDLPALQPVDGAEQPGGVHTGAVEIVVVHALRRMGRQPALEPVELAPGDANAVVPDVEVAGQMPPREGMQVGVGHGGPRVSD